MSPKSDKSIDTLERISGAPFCLMGKGYIASMNILLLFLTISTSFACLNDAIVIRRRTGISIGSNGNHSGSASHSVNIPVNFNGKWGCWEQQGGLGFDVKPKSRSMTVVVPKSKFQDLPGRTTSYAFIKKGENDLVEIDIATFVCVGNNVVAAETYEGDILKAQMLQSLSAEVSTTFATGAAAANLGRYREDMMRRFGKKTELPGELEVFFNQNFKGLWSKLEQYEMMVPSVYLTASMRTPLSNLQANYNTRVLTKSACSPEFESVMAPLRFENLKLPQGMKSKVKKGNLLINW